MATIKTKSGKSGTSPSAIYAAAMLAALPVVALATVFALVALTVPVLFLSGTKGAYGMWKSAADAAFGRNA